MPHVTMHQLARIAEQLGHTSLRVAQTRRGWVATCGCGFRSVRQPDQAHGEQAVADHIERVAGPTAERMAARGRLVS